MDSSTETLQDSLPQYYRAFLLRFRKLVELSFLFHTLFATLFLLQITCLLLFFSQPHTVAIVLLTLFLTSFTYFLLLFYLQGKRSDEMGKIRRHFVASCQRHLPENGAHLPVASALHTLFEYLSHFRPFPKIPFFRHLSFFYKDALFSMQKALLLHAVEEHLLQIRKRPTAIEAHATLATLYISLSTLLSFDEKQQNSYSKLALEELTILHHYAPQDPWVHEQLSLGFRKLGRFDKEIEEMEILHQLCPKDLSLLFRLGQLYFEQGLHAKGLKVYETLQEQNYPSSEELLSFYGSPPA